MIDRSITINQEQKTRLFMYLAVALVVGVNVFALMREPYWIPQGKFPPMTHLMVAASEGDGDRVAELIENGAIINECTALGANALFFAIYREHYDIAELLLTHGSDPNLNESNVAWMIIHPAQDREGAFLSLLLTDLDDNNYGYGDAMEFLIKRCDVEAIETLLHSMGERASWGVYLVERYIDMDSECGAEFVELVARYREKMQRTRGLM